ncbi:MAG: 4-vinyl reductase [Chloroflexota bacterium]
MSQHALEAIKEKIPAITRIETDKTAVSTTRPTSAKTSTSGSLVTTDQLNQLGQRLVVAYPQIRREIRRIDEQLDPAVRDDMLLQLGEALGKWQYRKNYSLGARLTLDKTLQRIVWPALEDFLQITKGETFVRVLDCPHCATEQTPTEPNCHFITGYIRGFLEVIPRLPSQQVIQTQSKALGHNACVFEIKQI